MSTPDLFSMGLRARRRSQNGAADGSAPATSLLGHAVMAYSLALGGMGLLEAALAPGGTFALFTGLGLGLWLGSLTGACLGATVAWAGRGPRARCAAVLLLGILAGGWGCWRMGIFAALSGGAPQLAAISLLVTLAGAAGFVGLLIIVARWRVGAMRPILIGALGALVLLLGAGVCIGAHWLVPPHYRSVQEIAVCCGAILFGWLLHVLAIWTAVTRRTLVTTGIGALGTIAGALFAVDRGTVSQRASLDAVPVARAALSLAVPLTDIDGDGYSSILGGGDCAPWDPQINPGAKEIPDNGLDDNCIWGDARARVSTSMVRATPSTPSPLSIVLITLDTVRWDRTGLAGRSPSPTPSLDAWARQAITFERAYTASTRTCSSLAAMHHGTFARALRWVPTKGSASVARLRERLPNVQLRLSWMCATDEVGADRRRPLAELLHERGMATAAVVNDLGTLLLQREFFGEGFDEYRDAFAGDDEVSVQVARDTLATLDNGARPFFLWVHLFGAHDRPSKRLSDDPELDYEAALRRTDATLAPLLSALDAAKTPVAVLLLSDHGELITPQGRQHALNLSEELLRVPLLVRAPGLSPRRSELLASSVDVATTILALTGTPTPPGLPGLDLTVATQRGTPLFSDTWMPYLGIYLSAAYDGRSKMVYSHGLKTYETSPQLGGPAPLAAETQALQGALDRYLSDNELNFGDYVERPR